MNRALESTKASPRTPWLAAGLLIACALVAYANSFQGAFVFDDVGHIEQGLSIRPLWPIVDVVRSGGPRWLLIWTLSLNYALGGLHPFGYHLFNLVVHVSAGLLLWDLVRRSLRASHDQAAESIAFAVALLWLVHPLQTQAVTYIVQRCEAMMALCFLGTLWCLVCSTQRRYPIAWLLGAIGFFWLGLGTKEVIIVAPLVALVFDRAFLASSWREVLLRRGWVYASMVLPLALVAGRIRQHLAGDPNMNTGFGMDSLAWWEYAYTQPAVILHYLRLVIVPVPLCIDYEWPVAQGWFAIVAPGLLIAALFAASLVAWFRQPRLGFLALSFFLVLAPTSSIVPIGDLAVEHRMYLPLAPVLVLLVLGAVALLRRLSAHQGWTTAQTNIALRRALIACALLCMALTIRRNADYLSPIYLWQATVEVRPQNARAHHNLSLLLTEQGRGEEALAVIQASIDRCEERRWPTRRHYVVLGETFARMGAWSPAAEALAQATSKSAGSPRVTPAEQRLLAEAFISLATASAAAGQVDNAEQAFRESIALHPDFSFTRALYGEFLYRQDRREEALKEWQAAATLRPDWFEIRRDLGMLLAELNRTDAALEQLSAAARLRPDDDGVAQQLRLLRAKREAGSSASSS